MFEFLKLWPYLWPLIKEYIKGAPEPGPDKPKQPSVKGPWLSIGFLVVTIVFVGDVIEVVVRELKIGETVQLPTPVTKLDPPNDLQICLSELNQLKQLHATPKPKPVDSTPKKDKKKAQERLERLEAEETL